MSEIPDYRFHDAELLHGSQYIWPVVRAIIKANSFPSWRAFDLGCGNGSSSNMLSGLGFEVTGIDPSVSGITVAKRAYPHCTFTNGIGYEDLVERFGQFGLVLSLEVLHHCAYPRKISQKVFELLEPGGMLIVAVTYHSYLKNLALALAGQLDQHFNALWDAGPLKFFSVRTLDVLLRDVGFRKPQFHRVGRIPVFAKSLIAVA